MDSESVLKTSDIFCDKDAEITFQSSDGVLFKIYQAHLQTASAGFSIPDSTVVDAAPICLEEPAQVLELLFQFIHPPSSSEPTPFRQPSVIGLEPDIFFAVAEAAEKYIVYGAMNVFMTRMDDSKLINSKPAEVLNHACKHGYPDLADKAANQSLALPMMDVVRGLIHPGSLAKWVAYYDSYRQVVLRVDSILKPGLSSTSPCLGLLGAHAYYSQAVNLDVRTAFSQGGCGLHYCSPCTHIPLAFQEAQSMRAGIPKFSQTGI